MFARPLAPVAVAALALISVLPQAAASPTSPWSLAPRDSQSAQKVDVSNLVPKLSSQTRVYIQGSKDFASYTVRWSALQQPSPNVVIVPGVEKDVAIIVKFASDLNIPFFAYNGHHGSITTLGRLTYGIEIYLPSLNSITISADKKSAVIGGGVNVKNLVDYLWAAGKQAVTGTCECVSYLGPALGGGHGWLEGRYGLASDQFLSLNIVLANGEAKTIDSSSDLWWAMGGAGHNFGIVTSATSKIYDIVSPQWAIETIIFSGDQVEAVYDAANKYILQGGKQAVDIINWSYWLNDPTLDPAKPVIIMYIIQQGVTAVDSKYTKAFHDLKPLVINPQSGTYKDLAAWTGIALASIPCQDLGVNTPRFPIYLKSYNIPAQRKVYNAYAAAVGGSSLYNNSLFLFEDYATGGVRAIPDATSAFAYRSDLILGAPLIIYPPTDKAGDAAVLALGNNLRKILQDGSGSSEVHAYVNYAYGTEGPQSWYGYQSWRQDRLKALKAKYDPNAKFSYYGPIGG